METKILFFVQRIICLFIRFSNVLIICQLIKCMICPCFYGRRVQREDRRRRVLRVSVFVQRNQA